MSCVVVSGGDRLVSASTAARHEPTSSRDRSRSLCSFESLDTAQHPYDSAQLAQRLSPITSGSLTPPAKQACDYNGGRHQGGGAPPRLVEQYTAALARPPVPPAALAHAPLLLAPSFDVDAFLLSRIHIPLDELRAELRQYLGVLREELVSSSTTTMKSSSRWGQD